MTRLMNPLLVLFVVAIVVVSVVGVSGCAKSEAGMTAEEAARDLLNASGVEDQLIPIMKQSVRLQMQGMQAAMGEVDIGVDMEIMDRWIDENITWSDFEPGYIEIYVDLYSRDEMLELAAFQRSALGRKSMELLPVMMERGGQLGMQILQDKLPALMELLDEAEPLEEEEDGVAF